jgi:hypothetical protein
MRIIITTVFKQHIYHMEYTMEIVQNDTANNTIDRATCYDGHKMYFIVSITKQTGEYIMTILGPSVAQSWHMPFYVESQHSSPIGYRPTQFYIYLSILSLTLF